MTSRSFTGLVLAAVLLAPAAATAQTRSGGGSTFGLGLLAGAEFGEFSGFQLRLDGEVPIVRANPNLQVAGVLSLSYAGLEDDLSVLEIVPAVRLIYTGGRQFGVYGDLGLGFARASQGDFSDTGATMRIGVGGFYQMNRQVQLPLELMIHPHFGDYEETTATLMFGAKFRF